MIDQLPLPITLGMGRTLLLACPAFQHFPIWETQDCVSTVRSPPSTAVVGKTTELDGEDAVVQPNLSHQILLDFESE